MSLILKKLFKKLQNTSLKSILYFTIAISAIISLGGFIRFYSFTFEQAQTVTPLYLLMNGLSHLHTSSVCQLSQSYQFSFNYVPLFGLTFLIEFIVILCFLKNIEKSLLVSFVLNISTHLVATFVTPCLFDSFYIDLLTAETFAIAVEFLIVAYYFKVAKLKSITMVSLANLISWQIGPSVYYWLLL